MALPLYERLLEGRGPLPLVAVQDRIAQAFTRLVTLCPLLDGRLVTGLVLAASANTVSHGLGRRPRGCFVVSSTVGAMFADNIASTADTSKTFTLTPSAGTTVSLWVF